MKILHVLNSPRAEGTPRLVLDWLTVKKHKQELLFLSEEGELKNEFIKTENWCSFNNSFVPSLKNAGKIITLVKAVCKERKPDIVIAWMMGFSPWVHWGAKSAGVKKLIVHAGNPPSDGFMHHYVFTYMSFWTGFLLNNKVICCSDYIRDAFRNIPLLYDKQFETVYNCFKPEKFKLLNPPERQPLLAIMVATLEPHKDHITLLNAWKILEEKTGSFKLLIAGNGGNYNSLTDYAKNLQLKTVDFLGSRTDIPELLHKSSLFVFSTTLQEGFGTVLIEALASGCKVVATDVPACREVLQQGKFGLLVPPKNAAALAEAILLAMNEPLTDEKQKEQLAYANRFTPGKMIDEYVRIVNSQ